MQALPVIQSGLAMMLVKVLFTPIAILACILKQEHGVFQATQNNPNFFYVERIWVCFNGMKT